MAFFAKTRKGQKKKKKEINYFHPCKCQFKNGKTSGGATRISSKKAQKKTNGSYASFEPRLYKNKKGSHGRKDSRRAIYGKSKEKKEKV